MISDPVTNSTARVFQVADVQRLFTLSSSEDTFITYAANGNAYIAYFEIANSTLSATEYAIAYMRNDNTTRDMVITRYRAYYGSSTGGTTDSLLKLYLNPLSSSTIVTAAVPAAVSNARIGETNPSQATIFVGNGTTSRLLSPGISVGLPVPLSEKRDQFLTPTVIPFSQAIGFSWTTPTSNTAQRLTFVVSFYMREKT